MDGILIVATVLGGIAAVGYLLDKWRSRSTAHYKAAADAVGATPTPPRVLGGETLPSTSAPSSKLAQEPETFDVLPLSEVLRAIHGDELTPLQRSDFVQRNEGRRVIWKARARTIQKLWENEAESDLIAVIRPADSEGQGGFRELATAVLPFTEHRHVSHVGSGEVIVLEGNLNFSHDAGGWRVTLRDAHFISMR